MFGPDRKNVSPYTGKVGHPTFSNVVFRRMAMWGRVDIKVPSGESYKERYVFATAFVRRNTGEFARTDGKAVGNSDQFIIR